MSSSVVKTDRSLQRMSLAVLRDVLERQFQAKRLAEERARDLDQQINESLGEWMRRISTDGSNPETR